MYVHEEDSQCSEAAEKKYVLVVRRKRQFGRVLSREEYLFIARVASH